MTDKYTVAGLKQLATAVGESATVVGVILADGKVNLADLAEAPAVFAALKDFAGVPFASLLPELGDIEAGEAAELATHFNGVFHLANTTVEGMVEEGLAIMLNIAVAVKQIRDAMGKVKVTAAA